MVGLVMGAWKFQPPGRGEFSKIWKKFLKKIAKLHDISLSFTKFKIPALNFRAFGRETQLVGGNFDKILKNLIQ